MSHRKLITAVILFIYLSMSAQLSYTYDKSVFVISSQDESIIKAFHIVDADSNYLTLQTTTNLPQYDQGAIALAAWPQKNLLFAVYDYSADNSSMIAWISSRYLMDPCGYNTGVTSPGLAGIAIDTGKGKIYVAQRQTYNLYIYKWNDVNETLEPNGMHVLSSIDNMYGLALDEPNSRLYVSDGTKKIRYYNTADTNSTWQPVGDFNIVVSGVNRAAVGIAIDPNRGYLYSGQYPDSYNGHNYLVRTLTASPHTSIETDIGCSVIGVDVDKDTGLVYCTTTANELRVYDSDLTNLTTVTGLGSSSTGPGPAGVAVGGHFEPPVVHNIEKNEDYTTIQSAIDNANNNNTLVASQGLYREGPNFGSKSLTLKSIDPNDPLVVAHTIIRGTSPTVTVANDSTLDGLTIVGGSGYGIYCYGDSNLTIDRCRIMNLGYGIVGYTYSNLTISHCRIENNGYGIYVSGDSAEITNSIIHHNNYGIQLNNTQSSEIRNNTIVENDYGIYRSDGNDPDVSNNIIWGGSPINWQSAKIKYNCIQDCIETYGNINDNPEFRNADAYDYHLTEDSNCINNGDPDFVAEDGETDIDGEARVNSRVDIGADEFYYCSGRVDIFPNQPDGIVNFLDFVVLANAWLMADGNDHFNDIVDFDSDGSIDAVDLKQFCDCWLWTTNFYEPVFDIQGDLMMSQQTSQAEQAAVSEAVVVQVEPQIVEIEPVVFDVNEILDWLDNLWETDEEIRGMIDPNSWLEFIESIKSSE